MARRTAGPDQQTLSQVTIMKWRVPLSDISFGDEEQQAVQRVLQSGWLSMGPETELFEAEFAEYLGSKHAIALSSGTAALHLALMALGLGAGDEVIVPAMTFVATANAVLYVGAKPVFADVVGPDDFTISPDDIERKITERTRAIIVMHYGGFPCRMDSIEAIADRHGLKIIEDAAHAPGASLGGKKLGTRGDLGCFSFFANKNMATGEGGMVVTDDADVAGRLKILRSHGMNSLTWDRHKGHSFSYDVIGAGYNYRIDELRSALGRVQLAKLERFNEKRREITRIFREMLNPCDALSLPFPEADLDTCACHIFPVLVDPSDLRSKFMQYLKEEGIQTSIHYPPVHRFSAYKGRFDATLPLTEDIADREVTLPLFPTMTDQQIEMVAQAVKRSLTQD
jgi:dTDP-4-amino-4,6-dideoxygalactose transaminase